MQWIAATFPPLSVMIGFAGGPAQMPGLRAQRPAVRRAVVSCLATAGPACAVPPGPSSYRHVAEPWYHSGTQRVRQPERPAISGLTFFVILPVQGPGSAIP